MKKPCMLRMCSGPIHCPDNPVPKSANIVQSTENLAPQLSTSIQPAENTFPEASTNPTSNVSTNSASESPPIQQGHSNTVLGFARTKISSFFPARKLGEIGKGHIRVKWLATGKIGTVPKDCWTIFSEQKALRFSKDRGVNKVVFAKGMEDLHALLDRLERDGEEPDHESQLHSESVVVTSRQPAAARKLARFSQVRLDQSEMLTDAAFSEYIETLEDGMLSCKECPNFTTPLRVVARRHAIGHGSKRISRTKKKEKKYICSKPGCEEKFVLISECDKHFREVHRVIEGKYVGGYKCWDCSTPDKPYILKDWRAYVVHLQKTKKHNPDDNDMQKCPDCEYSSHRGWLVERHMKRNHGPKVWLEELLMKLVSKVVDTFEKESDTDVCELEEDFTCEIDGSQENTSIPEKTSSKDTELDKQIQWLEIHGTSEYEKEKIATLKERRKLFHDLFGESTSFEKTKKRKSNDKCLSPRQKKKRYNTTFAEPNRRSNRKRDINRPSQENIDDPDETNPEEEKTDGDHVRETGEEVREDDEEYKQGDEDVREKGEEVLQGGSENEPGVAEPIEPCQSNKRFVCDFCEKSTSRLCNLKEHIELVHAVRDVECTR